ncbi:MAG: transporter substrate-binding domain-containing protein [Pseudomonadales bacterium]
MNLRHVTAAFALFVASYLPTQATAGETLKIATEGAYAPFNMTNAKGHLIGFDVDIANALCVQMQVQCEIVQQDWQGIIPALNAGAFDAIVASMSITEARLKEVDFTHPYYSNRLAFVAAKADEFATDNNSLQGKALGAQRDTIAGNYLERELGKVVDVKLYDTQQEAYAQLVTGQLDGLVSDKLPAYDWINSAAGSAFEFKGKPIESKTLDQIAIAVRKSDTALKERFNTAIEAIVSNGTYARINARYFPFSIY